MADYVKPFNDSNPDASFINGNPAAGIPGSIPDALMYEVWQRELKYVIEQGGITPSNADLTQVWQAIQSVIQGSGAPPQALWHYGDDTGVANGLVVDAVPNVTAYVRYTVIQTKVAAANTGPATINVDGLGVKTITRADGSPLKAGDLTAGAVATLLYDGTNFQVTGLLTSNLPSSGIIIFTTSQSYAIPDGVTKIKRARVWGGGGGGGGSTGAAGSGSGGGGGGYHEATGITVPPNGTLTITVGAGGAGGTNANGLNGGTSSVAIQGQSAIMQATGGGAGSWGNGGAQGSSLGGGGGGSGPGLSASGGIGSFAYALAGTPIAGAGGAGAFGGGSPTLNVNQGNNNGNFPSGGANGGVGGFAGGTGGAGLVILEI